MKIPKRRYSRRGCHIVLKDFSLVDNPIGTVTALRDIARAECLEPEVFIHFSDRQCMDITPLLIFGQMQTGLSPVIKGGFITPKMQKLIGTVGLTEFLQMEPFHDVPQTEEIWAFPLQQRSQLTDSQPARASRQRDRVIGHFVQSINGWLAMPEIGQALSKEGQSLVGGMITEALDNAEGHSSMVRGTGGWAVAGFMAKRMFGDKECYFCSIGIVSIGNTIAESFVGCHPKIRRLLDEYVRGHRGARPRLSEDSLISVCALQDGITSDWEKAENDVGGVGFQEVFDFINDLGGTEEVSLKPRLTIISGRTCIQARYPYISGVQSGEGATATRTLWFNAANSPSVAPDENHVYELPVFLPGTAISMAFTLDPAHLTRTIGRGHSDGDD